MTRPRSQLIAPESTPYYHCIARCVRRAFLCGNDTYSGKNFDHRKIWLLKRLTLLESVFSIDVAAYAVMSNHYHLVLHINTKQSRNWSMDDVISRWLKLYKGPLLIHRYLEKAPLSDAEFETVKDIVNVWRQRLTSISWFMACLNEYIARQANKEDGCKGRFWEGRFKSQALLDEAALLSCMAYVDLNPVRAGLANSLETSTFTSIQQRLQEVRQSTRRGFKSTQHRIDTRYRPLLMPFVTPTKSCDQQLSIPFNLNDYINLVDRTGRSLRYDKKGKISKSSHKALQELGISFQQWYVLTLTVQKKSILMLNGLKWLETYTVEKEEKVA